MIRGLIADLAALITFAVGMVTLYRWYRGWRWHRPAVRRTAEEEFEQAQARLEQERSDAANQLRRQIDSRSSRVR